MLDEDKEGNSVDEAASWVWGGLMYATLIMNAEQGRGIWSGKWPECSEYQIGRMCLLVHLFESKKDYRI